MDLLIKITIMQHKNILIYYFNPYICPTKFKKVMIFHSHVISIFVVLVRIKLV